ncbi:uncharacterized protein [Spinacia oleracea]|uniref:Expansin-like CBD domain-containing protein n=1 Tax=Spinacia oleracea TaxID=3562 RepID=A0ABM3R5L0_SPIOL|nr:uncharacterized protein LOC130466230 [Spinacia oleracea]XP_056690908.1 uncharacterized protein LOC130466230 [Spinacia oleracea]
MASNSDEKTQSLGLPEQAANEEAVGLFDYGWIKIVKIVNNTKIDVTFTNPNGDKTGTIEPGQSESTDCVGWVPYWDSSKKYTIKFFNDVHNEFKEISMVDLKGEWKLSLKMPEVQEDKRVVRPKWGPNKESALLKITVFNRYDGFSMKYSGYTLTDNDSNWEIGEFYESKRDW